MNHYFQGNGNERCVYGYNLILINNVTN